MVWGPLSFHAIKIRTLDELVCDAALEVVSSISLVGMIARSEQCVWESMANQVYPEFRLNLDG